MFGVQNVTDSFRMWILCLCLPDHVAALGAGSSLATLDSKLPGIARDRIWRYKNVT